MERGKGKKTGREKKQELGGREKKGEEQQREKRKGRHFSSEGEFKLSVLASTRLAILQSSW